MDHYADGLFTGNFITTWTRGKAEPVYWSSGAGHQGGYAYRLCKVPAGGVIQITEECFNQGDICSNYLLFFRLYFFFVVKSTIFSSVIQRQLFTTDCSKLQCSQLLF